MMAAVHPRAPADDTPPPEISVIVPFRDERAHLARCVDALLGQDVPPERYEVVLVDDGSTDGGAALVAGEPRVRLLRQERRGPYAARNAGVTATRGPIVAFTDGHCAPDRDWVAAIADALADPGVDLALGACRYGRDTTALSLLAALDAASARSLRYGYTNNLAVRRSALSAAGPFDEVRRGADTLLVRRLRREQPAAVRFVPAMRVRHLALTGTGQVLRRKVAYGWSEGLLASAVPASGEPVPLQRAAGEIAHDRGLRPAHTALLHGLAGAVGAAWWTGRTAGRATRRLADRLPAARRLVAAGSEP